jgi:hypothetical protein
VRKWDLTVSALILDFLTFRTMRNKVLMLNLSCCIIAAQEIKIVYSIFLLILFCSYSMFLILLTYPLIFSFRSLCYFNVIILKTLADNSQIFSLRLFSGFCVGLDHFSHLIICTVSFLVFSEFCTLEKSNNILWV